MNIGIFTDTYFPQINGVSTSTHLLERELTALGHNVSVFTTTDPKAAPEPHVYRMPSMPFAFLPDRRVGLAYPPNVLMKIRKLKLDIVHTHTEFSLGVFGKVVSEFSRIPLVHTFHTMYEDYVHYVANGRLVSPKMARNITRLFCNRAKAVITPAEKARDYLLASGVKRPVRVIPTGIDFGPFSPQTYGAGEIAELRRSLGVRPDERVILSLGRVAKEKSVDVLIRGMPEILTKLPNAKLVIVGDGPARPELQTLAANMGLENSVVFTGERPWTQIGRYYLIGDVFACASVTETQGLTYVEAMAAGLPVVAKFDRSIEKLVRNGETGYTFLNDDEFPALVTGVLADGAGARQTAARAMESISRLSSKQFALNVERLYAKVMRLPRPGFFKSVWMRIRR